MKKTLVFLFAALLLLVLSAFAYANGEETVPGTEFPMPDSVISVKSVSTEFREISAPEASIRGWDFNFRVTLAYDDPPTAVQAFEEYQAHIVENFPDLTDNSGNIMILPKGHSGEHNFLNLAVKRILSVTTLGIDSFGYCDLSSFKDVMEYSGDNSSARSRDEHHLSSVLMALRSAGTSDSFEKQISKIRETYDYYTIVDEKAMVLDGLQAYKLICLNEKAEPDEFCDSYVYVIYCLLNDNNDFYTIHMRAPEDGWQDESGHEFHPAITELCDAVENTFTRSKP